VRVTGVAVPVVLFGAALEHCVTEGAVYVVAETEGFVEEHCARRNPLGAVFAALVVSTRRFR